MIDRASRFVPGIFVVGLIVAILLGLAGPASGQSKTGIPDLDVLLVIDESGSMWNQNDPPTRYPPTGIGTPTPKGWANPGWRIVMANMFANLLGKEQSGARHRLGVITFGTDATLVRPLSDVQDDKARADLERALNESHKNLDWTDIPEALQLAFDELDAHGRASPNVKRVVVFLSDGKYEIHSGMSDDEVQEGTRRIREIAQGTFAKRGYPLYFIAFTEAAFREDATNKIYKNLWEEIASATGGEYYEPPRDDRSLQEVYFKIILRLLGLPQQNLEPPVEVPVTKTFSLPGDLLQVIFTVIKYDPDIATEITRPDQTKVKLDDVGVSFADSPLTGSYSISRPQGGPWTVQLSGRGKVNIVSIPFPKTIYRVQWLSPGNVHSQGKPMEIAVRVVDVDEKEQVVQGFSGTARLPDGRSVPLTFRAEGTNYLARLDNTQQRGRYALEFSGKVGGNEVRHEQTLSVVAAPWLKLLEPQPNTDYPVNRPVPVSAQLMFGDQPVSYPDPNDRLDSIARLLLRNDGRAVDTQQLRLGANGIFSGTLRAENEAAHVLRIQLSMVRPNGERVEDVSEYSVRLRGQVLPTMTSTFTRTPTPTRTWTPPPTSTRTATATPLPSATSTRSATATPPPTATTAPTLTRMPSPSTSPTPSPTPIPREPPSAGTVGGIGGGLLILLAAAGIGGWWMTRPALVGTLRSGDQSYSLIGKRPMVIGSDPKTNILVSGENVAPRHAELRAFGDRKNPSVEVRSLDPGNPVLVNGYPETTHTLANGDILRIGDQEFRVEDLPEKDDGIQLDPTPSDDWKL